MELESPALRMHIRKAGRGGVCAFVIPALGRWLEGFPWRSCPASVAYLAGSRPVRDSPKNPNPNKTEQRTVTEK